MESTPTATPAPPPANTPAPRVFVDCEVQTETIPLVISRQTTPIPRTLSCSVQNPEASPTQLPSPVSADHHAREIIPDALDHFERGDADDVCRAFSIHPESHSDIFLVCALRPKLVADGPRQREQHPSLDPGFAAGHVYRLYGLASPSVASKRHRATPRPSGGGR